MEQIVFPVPNICEYLTEESKVRVFTTTERDDQGSKVNDFFQQFDNLYNEMRWQKKIRSKSLHPESSARKIMMVATEAGCRMLNHNCHPESLVMLFCSKLKTLQWFVCACCICALVLMRPVMFSQKIRLCSGSRATSLFGGASPSTWPACSTLPWRCSTRLVMMEMKVSTKYFFKM